MDKTPIKVYEDKEVLKTPHSDIKRVLNITPANPLSPKDVNVQTPLIFKPKKLQIPEIFSPISKIKSLPIRQRYTIGHNENWEDCGTDDEITDNDAVTSTPIVPKRNRNYYNCLKITPKLDKNNVKIIEKKCNARKANTNTNDIYSLRRKRMKENLTNELKAVLHKKQLRHENDKKVSENLLPVSNKPDNSSKTGTFDSFEELKARFERVKNKAAETIDKSPSNYHTGNNVRIDTKKTSTYNDQEYLLRQTGDKFNIMAAVDNKTNKSIAQKKNELSEIEASKQESGSNLNYYTAFPDATNLASPKQLVPPVSVDGNLKYHRQKEMDHNDISGVQIIPKSLNATSSESVEKKSYQNNYSGNYRKLLLSTPCSLREKGESKIPKLNAERSNKKKTPSILIRDEDIDRITYKLNLGPTRTLNSTSIEKAKISSRNAAKVLSEPENCAKEDEKYETKTINRCQRDTKVKLAFQSPIENIIKKPNEGLQTIDDALTKNLCTVNSCNKVPTDGKTRSEPKRKPSFKISRQNKTETDTFKRSTSNRDVSLIYNTRKRKISFTGKNTSSEVHNSKIRVTSQCKITTCDKKISLQEYVSFSRNQLIQKQSPQISSKSIKECSEKLFSPRKESSSDYRNKEKPTFSQIENPCRVNSTFVIQNSNSCYNSYESIPKEDESSPHSIVSSCSSKVVSETKTKAVKSSLETLGECFKFRKKSTMYSNENKSNLKRSYSFVHIRVKDNKFDPKSFLDLHSLSQSFPKNSFHFSDTESYSLLPHDNFPKHSHKKRKHLKNLTKEQFYRKNPREERREPLKESEEIYDELENKDIKSSANVYVSKGERQIKECEAVYAEINRKDIISDDVSSTKVDPHVSNNEQPYHIGAQNNEQIDRVESFHVNSDKYGSPSIQNKATNQADPIFFKKHHEDDHVHNRIAVDIERDSLSDESDNCVVLNDEFFKKTQNIKNNEKELMDISKGVSKVENELSDLSKLHSEIKEDLVIKWACPTPFKSSSSSDNISEGNDSVKDDDDIDNGFPSRNAETRDHMVDISKIKSQLLNSKVIGSPTYDNQKDKGHFPSELQSEPRETWSKPFGIALKSRISSPLKSRTDRLQRDEYRIFLEEQNYRAIQMIESRLTRVEEKLGSLQSITLDIRNLLQANFDNPSADSKLKCSSSQEPVRPPPPPPLPPPPLPPSTEVFFFPLRSSTSHNSSLAGNRRKSSPRNKSLRPAITVDDLRSVTLRKVSKEQMQAELKQTAM